MSQSDRAPAAELPRELTPRGLRRRAALLARVTDDVEAHGLVDFSVRRAAKAAGTSHKVLLYHFGSADDLLRECLVVLRQRRVTATSSAAGNSSESSLSTRVRAVWFALVQEPSAPRVLDQAAGLALYDPSRYVHLGRDATEQYLPRILELCPAEWSEERRRDVSALVLACLRGMLADLLTSGDEARAQGALSTLSRMLDAEQGRDDSS